MGICTLFSVRGAFGDKSEKIRGVFAKREGFRAGMRRTVPPEQKKKEKDVLDAFQHKTRK